MTNNITIVGLQWGDEGKGKVTDYYSENASAVVRFQGGNNAGHTVVIGEKTYKFNIMPSGVLRGKLAIIGNGVVVDMTRLIEEIENFGVTSDKLLVSEGVPLIIPSLHQEMDAIYERASGEKAVGTTGRGIGPAYMDNVGRFAIKAGDLARPDTLPAKVEKLLFLHNSIRRGAGVAEAKASDVLAYLSEKGRVLAPYIGNASQRLYEIKNAGGQVVFEGAQGSMLDISHGSFPMVTSSNTIATQAAIGAGVSPGDIGYVVGVVKAYTTRVGNGCVPTELQDATGEHLQRVGKEFGVTTGRPRRCGWLDLALVARSAYLSGVHGLVVTKLDVLDELAEIKVCTGYMKNNQVVPFMFDANDEAMRGVEPVYEVLPGWQKQTNGLTDISDLPQNAREYLKFIEKKTGVPIISISTSPERTGTIRIADPVL